MLLEMIDICKDYPQGKGTVQILKHINLNVSDGDYIAIMGPSGSGKTTLMNLMGCLDIPTSGTYLLNGEAQPDHQSLFCFQHIYRSQRGGSAQGQTCQSYYDVYSLL